MVRSRGNEFNGALETAIGGVDAVKIELIPSCAMGPLCAHYLGTYNCRKVGNVLLASIVFRIPGPPDGCWLFYIFEGISKQIQPHDPVDRPPQQPIIGNHNDSSGMV